MDTPSLPPPATVLTVTALNRLVRDLIERQLPLMWIGGELSNLLVASSGHAYFTLKDERAQVKGVMFRQRVSLLDFRLANGLQVEVLATPSLYEARGDFQLQVEAMRPAGLGRLFEAFERLKTRLNAEGLFAAELKRPIPTHPRAVGIVTSAQGAALRDVLSTLARRYPALPVVLYPTPVQGEGAAARIADAILTASARLEVDTLIVCRGGGSIEDLWAFNEEVVARAIRACVLPVITGIGHETDFTIADFAADLRAPTPTAAAEHASPDRHALAAQLLQRQLRLKRALERGVSSGQQRLDHLERRLAHPAERVERQALRLQQLAARLRQSGTQRLTQATHRLERSYRRLERQRPDWRPGELRLARLRQRLERQAEHQADRLGQRLAAAQAALESLNPEAVLERGYVLLEKNGQTLHGVKRLHQGDRITLRAHDGEVKACVEMVQPGLAG